MKILKQVARILLGITFIFSGFVKGIDPLGSAYKFTDYFTSFGWESLNGFAFALGILLAFTEFAIGVSLVFKFFMKLTAWLSLLFMIFFSFLTLYIAITNPVTDCGCFGDALVLTNWQTFYKNLFFIALAIIVFKYRKTYINKDGILLPTALTIMTFAVYFYLVDYSYNHLPLIDFRPYKVGTNIPEAMQVPEDAPKDIYKTEFEYRNKKSGKVKTFTEENYPWQDTLNWEFVSMDNKLIQKGYVPPIHDFVMETPEGDDIKNFFLYDEGYSFLVIAYRLDKTDVESYEKINQLKDFAYANKMQIAGLTSSIPEDIADFKESTNCEIDFFNCDEITLKTIIRSNPGIVLIKNGSILGKWHYNDIPDEKAIKLFLDME